MQRREINPWEWSVGFGFHQAVEVTGAQRVLYCAGQTSIDRDGNVVDGDMAAQVTLALDNLEGVLAEAGMTFANVVRVTWYVTSIEEFRATADVRAPRLRAGGMRAASTLVRVAGLAFPELRVEITATAVA
jgi:enamine deaminase RidA (YjgF/YER057c/UK114 family)